MKNFVITAATLSGNKGAENMFTCTRWNLQRLCPRSRIYLLSYYPRKDRSFAVGKNITILDGRPLRLLLVTLPLSILHRILYLLNLSVDICLKDRVLGSIRRADLVLDIGGVTFSDGREIYLPFNLVTILPGLLLYRPVVKLAQAMGPFKGRLNRTCAAWVLPKLQRIYARGRLTADHLSKLRLSNVSISADVAFSGVPLHKSRENTKEADCITSRTVGIAPSSVVYQYCRKTGIDYVRILAEFCDWLIHEKKFQVVLLPYSTRPHTKRLKNNDLPVVHKIIQAMSSVQEPAVIQDELDSVELNCIMQQFQFFIGSRFHSMISALCLKLPLIVCGWGHKYREVMEQFDMTEFLLDYRELTLEILKVKFNRLMADRKILSAKLDAGLPSVVRTAQRQFEDIRLFLEQT